MTGGHHDTVWVLLTEDKGLQAVQIPTDCSLARLHTCACMRRRGYTYGAANNSECANEC